MAQNSRTTDVLLCREPVRVQLPPAVVQALAELAKHRKCRRTPLAAISGRGGHGSGALPILQLSIKSVDLHTRGHTYQTYIPDLHTRPTYQTYKPTRPTYQTYIPSTYIPEANLTNAIRPYGDTLHFSHWLLNCLPLI